MSAWLTATEAAAYTRRKSMAAWYEWRRRHGIVPSATGLIAKVDLDRVLKVKRPTRRMAAASLANLRKRA